MGGEDRGVGSWERSNGRLVAPACSHVRGTWVRPHTWYSQTYSARANKSGSFCLSQSAWRAWMMYVCITGRRDEEKHAQPNNRQRTEMRLGLATSLCSSAGTRFSSVCVPWTRRSTRSKLSENLVATPPKRRHASPPRFRSQH